ncbi:TPA: hypothetical protein N0F65_012446, partial [Lagenidium giganteum]
PPDGTCARFSDLPSFLLSVGTHAVVERVRELPTHPPTTTPSPPFPFPRVRRAPDMTQHERTALELAESSEWALLLRAVTDNPECADELDDFGMLPLHWACTDKNVPLRVVAKLVEANPSACMIKNKGGLIPLHIAIKAKAKLEVLKAIADVHDSAVCEETPTGETAAELAQISRLSKSSVQLLTEYEERVRASGRAPPRMSRFQSPAQSFYDDEDEDRENVKNASNTAGSVNALRATNPGLSTPLPPRWKLDKKCRICLLKFSYFKSRHHCRNCGESVCNTHSSRRLPLKHFGLEAPQRVCILCYDELRENGKPPSAVVNIYASLDRARQSQAHSQPRELQDQMAPPPPMPSLSTDRRSGRQQMSYTILGTASSSSSRPPKLRPSVSATFVTQHDPYSSSVDSSDSLCFDDDQKLRPRARTELQADMQEQVMELQSHVRELMETKERINLALAESNRKIQLAMQDKLLHESRIAELRDESILDVMRVSDVEPEEEEKEGEYGHHDDDEELKITTNMAEETSVDVAATCNYLGVALFEKGEFSSAILEFRKSVALHGKDPDVWYNLARALHSANELDDAELAARKALELRPDSYSALSLLGKVLHAKGDHDKSIEVFRQALGLMNPGQDSDSEGEDVGSTTSTWSSAMHREYFRRELEREWELIENEEKKLEEEKNKVVAEWVAVEEHQKEYNKKRESFEKLVRERFTFLPMDEIVAFNIGGTLFRSTVKVWTRDRFSMLAQLCTTKPRLPKLCVEEDAFFIDRDFWIFQFIYAFLKDNALPDAVEVLRELYCEASFYRIGLLRHAIEAKMIGDDAMTLNTPRSLQPSAASASASGASVAAYEGSTAFGRFSGDGVLHLADGNRYEGEFHNGQFHGKGTLYFPEGKLEGTWENGKQLEGKFTFSDGLEYAPKAWGYCTGTDRRFYSEVVSPEGIAPAGQLHYFDTGIQRTVPLGSYDAGNGIYTPSTGLVSAYSNPMVTREPSDEEMLWLEQKAAKADTKETAMH